RDRGAQLLGSEAGLGQLVAQALEGGVVAAGIVLEPARDDLQGTLHLAADQFVLATWHGHRPEPTPSSTSMWHFLYFLPLPHGQGSLRPTRGPLRTGTARDGSAGAAASSSSPSARMGPPPNAAASACCSTMRRGARGRGIICPSSRSSTRKIRLRYSSRIARIKSSNSLNASALYSSSGSRWP